MDCILEKIKKQKLEAQISRHSHKNSFLGLVLGEILKLRSAKNPVDLITDSHVFPILERMLKDIKTTLGLLPPSDSRIENLLIEKEILESYLPKKMSLKEIEEILEKNNFQDLKSVMMYFKENYSGKYDGKVLQGVFNAGK